MMQPLPTRASKALCSPHDVSATSAGAPGAQVFSPFFQAAQLAWDQLEPTTRTAIRGSCRSGRMLHDSSFSHTLKLHLAWNNDEGNDEGVWLDRPPTAEELDALLSALAARKAQLGAMHISTCGKQQAKSGAPPAIAPLFRPSSKGARLPASAACKPHVPPPSLCAAAAASQVAPRVCPAPAARDERPPGNTPNTDPTAASASTPTTTITCREQLLETIGLLLSVPVRYPYIHLQELHLTMGDWPAGLQLKQELFPTLTSLSVRLGAPGGSPTPEGEAALMEQLTQLTHLRSLSLAVKPNGGWQLAHAERLSARSDCLQRLSCLTALTRLELQLEAVCEPWGDSYSEYQRALAQPAYCEDDYEIRMYEAITERRHTLVYALRDMRSLQHLSCPGMWITPSELAPLPSSLIHMEIEGLLPPTFDEIADAEALDTPLLWDLPPQLRELRLLGYAACPRALAAIRPPPEVKGQTHGLKLHCFQLRFGVDDVVGSRGRLWDASEEAVGPALELLRATRPRPGEWTLQVAADGSKWSMGPPEDEEEGHEGWIGQRQAAGQACTGLVLHNMSLRAGDLEALTRAMPQLKRLELCGTALPPRSLYLLADLQHLEELEVDVCDVTDEALREAVDNWWEAAAWGDALGTCACAPALRRMTVAGVGCRVDVKKLRERVAGWLVNSDKEQAMVVEIW